MYDDDIHITYAGSDLHLVQSSLSHDLENLRKWLVSNRFTLNSNSNSPLIMFRVNKFPVWNYLEFISMKI